MTLNSIIKRIKTISLAQQQVREFFHGLPSDFLTDKKRRYSAVLLQDNGGSINISSKTTTLAFKMYVVDLVHVSEDQKQNELDVQSDCLSIAEDLIAEMDNDIYSDWALTPSNNINLLVEKFEDLVAGIVVDIEIKTPYLRDVCAVPTN